MYTIAFISQRLVTRSDTGWLYLVNNSLIAWLIPLWCLIYISVSSLIFNVYSNNLYHFKALYKTFLIIPPVLPKRNFWTCWYSQLRTNELAFTTNYVTFPTNSKLNQHAPPQIYPSSSKPSCHLAGLFFKFLFSSVPSSEPTQIKEMKNLSTWI